jgi:glycosyltransferase involved in cell wall biosynthesis
LPIVQLIFRKTNPLFFSIEKVFASLQEGLKKEVVLEERYLPYYSSSISDIIRNIRFAKKFKADIYHITGDIHYVALALPAGKTILTIHDSVFLRESRGLKRIFFKWIFLKRPVKNCRFVTTISEKSKIEIVRNTGCEPGKVVVIPNPVNRNIYFRDKTFNTENPVLLFIGSTPNKNLDRTIRAISGISCTLDIVGQIPDDHRKLLKEHGIQYRQSTGLSEAEMADRYVAADIILFASLYEGFGLPILEGQKAGRVVLTSNISPMKEVAGEGACFVDPLDVNSIRAGLKKIIGDADYRDSLTERGFENIKKYEMQHIADQYLKLYETVMNHN